MIGSMAHRNKPFRYCEGAPSWNPTTYTADAPLHARAEALLADDEFASAIAASFSLPPPHRDKYTYHAIISVTLAEVQHAISLGRQNGLHAWYFAPSSPPTAPSPTNNATNTTTADPPPQPQKQTLTSLPPPPRADIESYLSLFSPYTSTPSALKTLLSNAKKDSLRLSIATYLQSKRYLHPSLPHLSIAKVGAKKASVPMNPYLQFLNWSCTALEWAGPCPASTLAGLRSHPILPVLMHHFGCACPSHEALSILRLLAAGREVLDIGSGGGYWTYMLRAYGVRCVAVDNAQSAWRVTWVDDTVLSEGAAFLKKRRARKVKETGGNADANAETAAAAAAAAVDPDEPVLLLVYPIVGGSVAGGSEGGFTRAMLDSYSGDTLAVVGTQNRNGYTGFRGESMDEYMEREQTGNGWVKVVQVALPSFPGKDEALFVFQRGTRAPQDVSSKEVGGEKGGKSKGESKSGSSKDNKGAP
ncbi:uncharacterized protein F4807DRAFT_346187 [Annulohypoxylon truncatum]|uniref:uncharacterized protein n=1 Tax=Annulohypoxylon truncatum TaxID=327061 RepID=UPI002007C36C|nr:uncharacterized protein F4807DRAFT_346187 [Annulohypoxylon truncatum]KAI1212692.1 hypothetical protein F4807DRAFT_346187 [Annulohypoxylon truncatum]